MPRPTTTPSLPRPTALRSTRPPSPQPRPACGGPGTGSVAAPGLPSTASWSQPRGTGSYGAVLSDVLEEAGYRVVEAPTPRRERDRGKTDDEKDAVLIARLTAQLRCYVPEPVDETWGRLRHLAPRREQLIVEMVSQVQQIRALLECVWPAALDTAKPPFRSRTWAAAMSVICERDGGDLDRTRRLGPASAGA